MPFHGSNTGSNPVGDAKKHESSDYSGLFCFLMACKNAPAKKRLLSRDRSPSNTQIGPELLFMSTICLDRTVPSDLRGRTSLYRPRTANCPNVRPFPAAKAFSVLRHVIRHVLLWKIQCCIFETQVRQISTSVTFVAHFPIWCSHPGIGCHGRRA